MRKTAIQPSLACADLGHIGQILAWLEESGADWLHIDVMDGHYVPNMGLGADFARMLRRETKIPLDIHLMCQNAERFLDMLDVGPGEQVHVHADGSLQPHRLMLELEKRGCVPGLVIGVSDSIRQLEELLPMAKTLNFMAVDSGCPGVEFHNSVFDRLEKVKNFLKSRGLALPRTQIDGSVSPGNIQKIVRAGFDGVVLGYPGCFNRAAGYKNTLAAVLEGIRAATDYEGGEKA